ncbi:MAG TPA: prolyl oligopeptidase family serine peptidase [Acidimicrobiales bacterium]|nr:prolyl oligopeptidase family serine peptidase [Acidimicrobiales bacterium]
MSSLAPYGTWQSPVQGADLVESAVTLGFPTAVAGAVLWQEGRPAEGGRVALVRRDALSGELSELLGPDMSARTTVHEYGGRCWAAGGPGGERLVTSNFADQRLWDFTPGRAPRPLTPVPAPGRSVRYANPVFSPDGAWVVVVRESHQGPGADHVVNDLVAVRAVSGVEDVSPQAPRVVASGHDFYSSPVFSSDGAQLAFLCWDHPDMPWDATQLWRGEWRDGVLEGVRLVVGAPARESITQPQWSPEGELLYISDRSGWWNLYCDGANLAPKEAEFAGPDWTFGNSDYARLANGNLVAVSRSAGADQVGMVEEAGLRPIASSYRSMWHLAPAGEGPGEGPAVLAVAGSPSRAPELVRLGTDGSVEVLHRSRSQVLAPEWVSEGEHFSFPTGNGETAHAFYYAPVHPGLAAPAGESPPLVVTSHGGPTAATSLVLDLWKQFWTTRGFAVVDVDYRGSTGYGRAYREALYGTWGLADVEDCAAAARALAAAGKADPGRMVVRGGSASGLTVLAALARYDVFAAGCVRFPVTDVRVLEATTHKFESHYMQRLVPPSEYDARSPLLMAAKITAPVLFFQGLDDRVVPPQQSRDMVDALRRAGTRALLVELEGESHGFRRAPSIVRSLEAELAFFGEVLGLEPAGDLARARSDLAAAAAEGGTTWRLDHAG